jgi:hypothetical protein
MTLVVLFFSVSSREERQGEREVIGKWRRLGRRGARVSGGVRGIKRGG